MAKWVLGTQEKQLSTWTMLGPWPNQKIPLLIYMIRIALGDKFPSIKHGWGEINAYRKYSGNIVGKKPRKQTKNTQLSTSLWTKSD